VPDFIDRISKMSDEEIMAERRKLDLTDEQFLATLKRIRQDIANGETLEYFDDTMVGNKDTQCTWGACCRRKDRWPDPATHLWPGDKRDEGKLDIYGIKYRTDTQLCPMDKREKDNGMGCFYSCRVFQGPIPTREEAIQLFDLTILKRETK
jgi:hypothetical protein